MRAYRRLQKAANDRQAAPVTPGTPLVRLCLGGFRHRPPRKTSPEVQQTARIGCCAERIRQPSIEASVTALLETQHAGVQHGEIQHTGLSYGALRKECLETVRQWPGCETVTVGGIQIIRDNTPGGFSVRGTLYGKANKKIADRAITCVQREKRRHFHLK